MDNIGGLVKLYICPVTNLTTAGKINDIANLIPILFTEDTGRRKCIRKSDKTGEYYDLTIECIVTRSDDILLNDFLKNDFALVSVDRNGVGRLDGNQDEPIRYEIEADTGEKFEDLHRVSLKFSRKLRFPSPVISL